MNLDPDAVRESLRSAVRSRLQQSGDDWPVLCGLGAPAFDAAPELGGLGLGLTASTAIAEELGRAALSTRYLAVAFAIDAAPPSLVEGLVAGDLSVTLAGFEAGRPSEQVATDAEETDLLCSPVIYKGQPVLGFFRHSKLDIAQLTGPAGTAGRVSLIGVEPEDQIPFGYPTPDLPTGPLARARVRQAAYLLGLARGALVIAVRHTTRRRQFDQALRDFQSVAFRLSTAYVELEALRLTVAQAIWLADTARPFAREATQALAGAAETAQTVIRLSMQLCGVRAMTPEVPVHRHYLRMRREAGRLGRPGDLWRDAGLSRLRDRNQ